VSRRGSSHAHDALAHRRGTGVLWLIALLGISGAAFGCYGQPIPRVARAGTTILLPAGSEDPAIAIGFGSEVTRLHPLDAEMGALEGYDDQRGEMEYFLTPLDATTPEIPLRTRFVTRLAPDPASPAAIAGATPGFVALPGQVVALVDIPADAPAGRYRVRVRVRRRVVSEADPSRPEDWEVLYEAGSGASGTATFDVSSDLASLVPLPKISVVVDADLVPPGPAAGRLVLRVPGDRIEVAAVFEDLNGGRGGLVRWSAQDPNRVEIEFAAPDRDILVLAAAFRHRNGFDPALPDAHRVSEEEFQLLEGLFYDADGSPIAESPFLGGIR
jgi:hypothetical protein